MANGALLTSYEVNALENARKFLNIDAMRHRAPALFAQSAHPDMSSRYSFTNTYDIVLQLHNRGWQVSSIMGGEKKWSKMMIRMRRPSDTDGPELNIVDSHDGTSRFILRLGWFRFVCSNGMVVADLLYSQRWMHTDEDIMAQILLELEDIHEHTTHLTTQVNKMRRIIPNMGQRAMLADAATAARFDDEKSGLFFGAMRRLLLTPRRDDDRAPDLYTVTNMVQENIVRGGFRYSTDGLSHGPRRTLQDIRSIDRNVKVNQAIWKAANDIVSMAA